jgi:hypothetical protein
VQSVPAVQPEGWKANDVPPFSMASFTAQSGRPLALAAMASGAAKAMSFWVPAIAASVVRETSTRTVSPALPVALPMTIIVPPTTGRR